VSPISGQPCDFYVSAGGRDRRPGLLHRLRAPVPGASSPRWPFPRRLPGPAAARDSSPWSADAGGYDVSLERARRWLRPSRRQHLRRLPGPITAAHGLWFRHAALLEWARGRLHPAAHARHQAQLRSRLSMCWQPCNSTLCVFYCSTQKKKSFTISTNHSSPPAFVALARAAPSLWTSHNCQTLGWFMFPCYLFLFGCSILAIATFVVPHAARLIHIRCRTCRGPLTVACSPWAAHCGPELTIGLAPTLWGYLPVWGEEWVFSVIPYIAFSCLMWFWG
jgi:hypothetical protein